MAVKIEEIYIKVKKAALGRDYMIQKDILKIMTDMGISRTTSHFYLHSLLIVDKSDLKLKKQLPALLIEVPSISRNILYKLNKEWEDASDEEICSNVHNFNRMS